MASWDNPKPVWAVSVFIIGSMLIVSLTFLFPWFMVTSDDGGSATSIEYYHNRYKLAYEDTGDSEEHDYDPDNYPGEELISTGEWSRNLRMISLVALLGLVLAMALSAMGRINRLIPLGLYIPPVLLGGATLAYTAVSYPSLVLEDQTVKAPSFAGSEGSLSWGPGLGWVLMLLAVLAILGCALAYSVFLWRERRKGAEKDRKQPSTRF